MKLSGQTIVITGASSGLGRALALELAKHNVNLVLFARNKEKLLETQKLCSQFNSPSITPSGDVTKPKDCQKLIDLTVEHFGALDILIANAGIGLWAMFEDITDLAILNKIMATNYLGAVNTTQQAIPHLKKSKGIIAVISSIQGKQGVPLHTGYAASKHALHGFFDSLRIELQNSGIDILIAMPSWIRNPDWRQNTLGMDGQPRGESGKRHSKSAVSLEQCAQTIVKAILKRKREIVIPAKLKFLPLLNLINPRIVEFFIRRKLHDRE